MTTGSEIFALCGVLMTALIPLALAQTPKVNTHDASTTRATKTVKANARKAGGAVQTADRKTEATVGMGAHRAGAAASKDGREVENAVGKEAQKIGHAFRHKH